MPRIARARVFVLFLDTYHVDVGGSHTIRKPLVDALDRVIGPDDLVAVMTPEMSAHRHRVRAPDDDDRRDPDPVLALGRTRPGTAARSAGPGLRRLLSEREREWRLGQVQGPERHRRGDDRSAPRKAGARCARRPGAVPARRARGAQGDSGDNERLAAVSPRPAPDAQLTCHGVPTGPPVAIDPRSGRLTTREQTATPPAAQCDADRMRLAQIDNDAQFRDILDEANRANASFYPIDPRGLAVFDTPIVRRDVPGPAPPMVPPSVDTAMLRRAHQLAANPRGGDRRPGDRQLERSRRRPAARRRRSELGPICSAITPPASSTGGSTRSPCGSSGPA